MNQFSSLPQSVDRYTPDGAYAFARLAVSLLIAALIGAGMGAVIVVLPPAQLDFGVDRSFASLPYTVMMCSLAFSTIALGRMTDRFGIVLPLAISDVTLGVGFGLAGYAPNLALFTAAYLYEYNSALRGIRCEFGRCFRTRRLRAEPGRVHRRPRADRIWRGNRLRADDGGHFALVRKAARRGGRHRRVRGLFRRNDLAARHEPHNPGDRLARDLCRPGHYCRRCCPAARSYDAPPGPGRHLRNGGGGGCGPAAGTPG